MNLLERREFLKVLASTAVLTLNPKGLLGAIIQESPPFLWRREEILQDMFKRLDIDIT